MAEGMRVTLKWAKLTRKVVLVAPPFPKVGDRIQAPMASWKVTKVEKTDVQVIPRKEASHV